MTTTRKRFYVVHYRIEPVVGTYSHRVLGVHETEARDALSAISKVKRSGVTPLDNVEYLSASRSPPIAVPEGGAL